MDDINQYTDMRDKGATAQAVYLAAKADGYSLIDRLVILKTVFQLNVTQAKEVYIIAEGAAASLEEHQAKLLPVIEEALRRLNDENDVLKA